MNIIPVILLALFGPLAFASVEPWARSILEIGVLATAAAIVLRNHYLYTGSAKRTLIPSLLAVAFIGLIQLAVSHPVNAPCGWLPFTVWRHSTIDGIVLWVTLACAVFSTEQTIEKKYQLKALMWAVFLTGLAVAFMGIFQKTGNTVYIYGFRKITDFGVPPFGPFINRDNAANYMVMSSLCGLGLFLAGFNRYENFAGRGKKFDFFAKQGVMALMLGICVYGVIFSGSRGGIHSLAAALFITAVLACVKFLSGRKKLAALGISAVLAGCYLLLVWMTPDLLARNAEGFQNTVLIRLSMYKSGLAMFRDFPLFGTGLNSIIHAFPYYQNFTAVPGTVEHVHSDWLELLLTVGLAGTLAFLAGFAVFMYKVSGTVLKSLSVEKALIGICLIAAISATCIHACTDFPLSIPANAVTFFLLMGALSSKTFEKTRSDFDPERKIKTRAKHYRFVLPPVAIILAVLALPPAIANVNKLDTEGLLPAEKERLLKKALYWDPSPRNTRSAMINYINMAVRDPQNRPAYIAKASALYLPSVAQNRLFDPLNQTADKITGLIAYDRQQDMPQPPPQPKK